MSSHKRLSCSIQTLLHWKKITFEVSESIYLFSEALTSSYNISSNLSPEKFSLPLTHRRNYSPTSSVEKSEFIYKSFNGLQNRKMKILFEEIVLNNNIPLLHMLKKRPALMHEFICSLTKIHDSIMAHTGTVRKAS